MGQVANCSYVVSAINSYTPPHPLTVAPGTETAIANVEYFLKAYDIASGDLATTFGTDPLATTQIIDKAAIDAFMAAHTDIYCHIDTSEISTPGGMAKAGDLRTGDIIHTYDVIKHTVGAAPCVVFERPNTSGEKFVVGFSDGTFESFSQNHWFVSPDFDTFALDFSKNVIGIEIIDNFGRAKSITSVAKEPYNGHFYTFATDTCSAYVAQTHLAASNFLNNPAQFRDFMTCGILENRLPDPNANLLIIRGHLTDEENAVMDRALAVVGNIVLYLANTPGAIYRMTQARKFLAEFMCEKK